MRMRTMACDELEKEQAHGMRFFKQRGLQNASQS